VGLKHFLAITVILAKLPLLSYVQIQNAERSSHQLERNVLNVVNHLNKGGNKMPLKPFTRNYEDNSTDAGFQFTFYCDLCGDGYKTQFIESKTYRKSGLLKGIARGISVGASLLGVHNIGYNIERGANIFTERFEGMSPEWHKEHEAAFELAQNEAKSHFIRCPRCKKWVCESDWNEQEGLCV